MVTPTSAMSYAFSAATSWMMESSNMTFMAPSSGMLSPNARDTPTGGMYLCPACCSQEGCLLMARKKNNGNKS